MRKGVVLAFGLAVGGCQTSGSGPTADSRPPPDAKVVILAAKGHLWKDPDSIKNASITAPRRSTGILPMWHVCVRANAKNSFGGYAGEKDMLIGIYDDARPPSALSTDVADYCNQPHESFPELTGSPPAVTARSK